MGISTYNTSNDMSERMGKGSFDGLKKVLILSGVRKRRDSILKKMKEIRYELEKSKVG